MVDAYSICPRDIRAGDVMMFVVKAMVVAPGVYRLYRCRYEGEGIPQGSRLSNEEGVCRVLFPSLAAVAVPDA